MLFEKFFIETSDQVEGGLTVDLSVDGERIETAPRGAAVRKLPKAPHGKCCQ
jgi:hypothetical protein